MRDSGIQRSQSNNVHLDIELLSAYIDGEVTPAEKQHVERHLATCHACVGELESLRWTVNLLHEVPPVAVPRPFAVREADLERQRRRFALPAWLFGGLRWATVATALLLILVLSADLLKVVGPAPIPRSAMAPESQEMRLAKTMVVKKEVEKPAQLEGAPSARKAAPGAALATLTAPREEEMELARAPEAPAEPQARRKGREQKQQPPSPTEAAQPPGTVVTPGTGEGETVGREARGLLTPQGRGGRPISRLRPLEIGLTGLLAVLLGLMWWVRRWS